MQEHKQPEQQGKPKLDLRNAYGADGDPTCKYCVGCFPSYFIIAIPHPIYSWC